MRPVNDLIIAGLATNATRTSSMIWANSLVRASIQIVVTGGSSAGSLQLSWSNDSSGGNPISSFIPTNWTALGSAVAVAAPGLFAIALTELTYEWLKLVYTDSSSGAGNGTITARLKGMAL